MNNPKLIMAIKVSVTSESFGKAVIFKAKTCRRIDRDKISKKLFYLNESLFMQRQNNNNVIMNLLESRQIGYKITLNLHCIKIEMIPLFSEPCYLRACAIHGSSQLPIHCCSY